MKLKVFMLIYSLIIIKFKVTKKKLHSNEIKKLSCYNTIIIIAMLWNSLNYVNVNVQLRILSYYEEFHYDRVIIYIPLSYNQWSKSLNHSWKVILVIMWIVLS